MINVLSLPSISLQNIDTLPNIPAIYLFCIGKTVLYVGKALSLSARHDPDRHHVYSLVRRIEETRRVLLQLKWIDFSPLPYDRAELDVILLGFEEHLIEFFKPQWNSRLNGIKLENSQIDRIYTSLNLIKESTVMTYSIEATSTEITTTSQGLLAITESLEVKKLAQKRAEQHNQYETFSKQEWNLCDQVEVKKLVSKINSYRAGSLPPSQIVTLGLLCLAEKLNHAGIPIEEKEPDISSFAPQLVAYPKLVEIANDTMLLFPKISLDELILRCTAKDMSNISPIDYAILYAIHRTHKTNAQVAMFASTERTDHLE